MLLQKYFIILNITNTNMVQFIWKFLHLPLLCIKQDYNIIDKIIQYLFVQGIYMWFNNCWLFCDGMLHKIKIRYVQWKIFLASNSDLWGFWK